MRCLAASVVAASVLVSAGVSAQGVFDEAVKAAGDLPRLHSLVVSQGGQVTLERYFNGRKAASLSNVKSVSKSVICGARRHCRRSQAAVARRRRLRPTFRIYPTAKRDITVEDLLTMRSGLESTSNRNYGAWVQSPNWVRHALARPLLSGAGHTDDLQHRETRTSSRRSSRRRRARAPGSSRRRRSRSRSGFSLAPWVRDPQGIYFGGNEMVMTPRQMLAFGELYLNGGQRERPADPVERRTSTKPSSPAGARASAAASMATAGGCARWRAGRRIMRGDSAGSSSCSCPVSICRWCRRLPPRSAKTGATTGAPSTTSSSSSSSRAARPVKCQG